MATAHNSNRPQNNCDEVFIIYIICSFICFCILCQCSTEKHLHRFISSLDQNISCFISAASEKLKVFDIVLNNTYSGGTYEAPIVHQSIGMMYTQFFFVFKSFITCVASENLCMCVPLGIYWKRLIFHSK